MELVAYKIPPGPYPVVRPAQAKRPWMDSTAHHMAYRCLPLAIANQHGWEIQSPHALTAVWSGGPDRRDICIQADEPSLAISELGGGILSFRIPYLFRTAPGYGLWLGGPVNSPKDGIFSLTRLVDESSASLTVNWMFTRPRHGVRFKAGEPFGFFFPIPLELVHQIEPEFRALQTAPKDFQQQVERWRASRDEFLRAHKSSHAKSSRDDWQKHYYQGIDMDEKKFPHHQTKLGARPFSE